MANRVFIVEPQWNPSVENQAIARALRLGQAQAVHVTRYVVDKTVEQVSDHGRLNASDTKLTLTRKCGRCKTGSWRLRELPGNDDIGYFIVWLPNDSLTANLLGSSESTRVFFET